MSDQLEGRRALVTGSGHSIGAAIAKGLAEAGADVVVHHGHSPDEAAETARDIEALGRRCTVLQADVTDTNEVNGLVGRSAEFLGGLDIVVCNAGHLVGRRSVAEMDDDHYLRVMEVNVGSTFRTVRAAIPHLRESDHGRVVTMASMAAHNGGGAGAAMYAAAKAAVRGLTKGLAKELGPDGVTVNSLAPGFITETRFHDRFSPEEAQQNMLAGIPLGRAGLPSEVAAAVTFLCSDGGAFVNGATIDIDGGAWFR